MTLDDFEEIGSVIDEGSPGLATDENVVSEETEEEWNVNIGLIELDVELSKELKQILDTGLNATNTEFDKGTEHVSSSNFVSCSAHRELNKRTAIVRLEGKYSSVSSEV